MLTLAKHTTINSRASAALLSWQVIDRGQSLDNALADYFKQHAPTPAERGFIQELVYGVCRWYGQLDALAAQLLKSPIRNKDRVLHFVLLVGLYQLRHLGTADHAAVSETVNACVQLHKGWAKKMINACLRNAQRQTFDGEINSQTHALTHPAWLVDALQQDWGEYANAILTANNQRPPMCLRVNRRQYSRQDYLLKLQQCDIAASLDPYAPDGLILAQAVPVSALPEFDTGASSIQDTAAQLACDFLAVEQDMHVLDACAAPGGKTAHLLERTDNLIMQALDVSAQRCEKLINTLARLELSAQVICADASQPPSWTVPAQGYDRILLDAPCSGLGVIRRHPDIKHHRRACDIDALVKIQQTLMQNLWQHLKPNGLMLYLTCSVLQRENEQQIQQFLSHNPCAQEVTLDHPHGLVRQHGIQTLPGVHQMDGFYYCLIRKKA